MRDFPPSMKKVLIIFLTCANLCMGSMFMGMLDSLLGFGPSKMEVMHAILSIKSNRDWKCRTALSVMDHEYSSMLLNALPSLNELLTENEEFIAELTVEEQYKMLRFYIVNLLPGKTEANDGRSIEIILSIINHIQNYNLLNLALEKKLICERELIIFFLNRTSIFAEAIKADVLVHLDITIPIVEGKGILHVLAEEGKEGLCNLIFSRLPASIEEKIKMDHFTKTEGNSILHSAILSNDPKTISTVARHFNRLCGHFNKFEMSPLKLALLNGNHLESINVLLDHGCTADGDEVISDSSVFPTIGKYYEFTEELNKLAKWSPKTIKKFQSVLMETFTTLRNRHYKLDEYKFFGLLSSYREFIHFLDKTIDGEVKIDFVRRRGSPDEGFRKSLTSSLWKRLTEEPFNLDEVQNVSLSHVIDGTNFNSSADEVKTRVLKNLMAVESFDYSGTTLTRFIKVIVQFSDPSVLAHFVGRDIDYYFCVRALFRIFPDYERIVPFLDAIGFRPNVPFMDGLYPIHLAVQTNNLKLVHFLINFYGVKLTELTVYEKNNILHYGLEDSIDREMIDFLLGKVPELLSQENTFLVTPLQWALLKTEKFEIVRKIVSVSQKLYQSSGEYSHEINEIFSEIMMLWPPEESTSKENFLSLLQTCGTEENARFLLKFVAKRLLKHFRKSNSSLSLFNSQLMRSFSFSSQKSISGSPITVTSQWSP